VETTVTPRPQTQVRMPSTRLAPRGTRLVAALIDSAIAMVIYLVAIAADMPAILVVGLLALAAYQIYLLSVFGQTIGKRAMNVRIVTNDREANGGFVTNVLLRTVLNSIIAIVPFYALVDILFIFRNDQRCIHDLIAGTKVIKA
jgi:uncharacterized RDD family membrane protein YckC